MISFLILRTKERKTLADLKDITLRSLEGSDFVEVMEIVRALPQWFSETGIKHIEIDLKYQRGLVATKDDRIIGFFTFYVYEGQAQLAWIGVLPEFHRQGIGRLLLTALIETLKTDGIGLLKVNTLGDSVDYSPYEFTRAFYSSLGFRESQRIQQDNPDCPELLILAKDLSV